MKKISLYCCSITCLAMVLNAPFIGFAHSKPRGADKSFEPAEELTLPALDNKIRVIEKWSVRIGQGVGKLYTKIVPAITENGIYAADASGLVSAYKKRNGKLIWQTDLQVNVGGGVYVGYGVVLLGTTDGEVIALSSENGQLVWRQQLSSEVLAAPQTNGDIVVAQTGDGRLFGLDKKNGSQRWVYSTTTPSLVLRGTSTPYIYNDAVLTGFANGELAVVDLKTGLPLWEQAVALPNGRSELERIVDIDGNFVVEGNHLYVSTYQGKLAAYEINSGRTLWQQNNSTNLSLEEGLGNIYATLDNSAIKAVDRQSGAEIWQQKALLNRKLTAPTKMGNYVVMGDFEGYLHWISQVDGHLVARQRVNSLAPRENPVVKQKARYHNKIKEHGLGIRTRPVSEDGVLYVLNNSGTLTAYEIKE